MRLFVGFIRAVVAGLAVGGLSVLLAHLAGAAEPSRRIYTDTLEQDDIAFAQPYRSSSLFDRVIQTSGDPTSSHHALVVEDLSHEFLRRFMAAPVMTTDFGGIRRTIDLHRSDDAAWALASCASAAGLTDAT